MKKIFVIVLLTISYSLFSLDLSWNSPTVFSKCDLYILEEETLETAPEFTKKPTLLDYYSDRSFLQTSFFIGNDFVTKKDSLYNFLYFGTEINANLKDRLFLHTNFWTGYYFLDYDFALDTSPLNDGWLYPNDDVPMIDNVSGKLYYKSDFGTFSIGRGKYMIGNNIGGSVILNNSCDDYGYFASKLEIGKISLQYLHGMLIPDSTNADVTSYKNYDDKFLVTHKINWKPNENYHFFIGEHVIYGSRNMEFSYFLPHSFYRITEHRLNDRDNVLIYSGFNWRPNQTHLFYLNFIFDELSPPKLFTDWWGNKYAIQIGENINYNSHNFSFEFSAVRPWMYTHKALPNKFSHNKIGLGFPEGSNLIQFSSELHLQIMQNLELITNIAYVAQGSTGNNFSINYTTRESDSAVWLDGDITQKAKLKSVINWKLFGKHRIKIGLEIPDMFNEKDNFIVAIGYQLRFNGNNKNKI